MLENLATYYIEWLSFRIHNEAKYNNVILTETKNAVAISNVAIITDLIIIKKTETEKILISICVTVDDKINLNKFKKRRSDR